MFLRLTFFWAHHVYIIVLELRQFKNDTMFIKIIYNTVTLKCTQMGLVLFWARFRKVGACGQVWCVLWYCSLYPIIFTYFSFYSIKKYCVVLILSGSIFWWSIFWGSFFEGQESGEGIGATETNHGMFFCSPIMSVTFCLLQNVKRWSTSGDIWIFVCVCMKFSKYPEYKWQCNRCGCWSVCYPSD